MKWVKVKLKNHKDLHVGVFYVHERDQCDLDELQNSLNELSEDRKKPHKVILISNFNCLDIHWSTHTAHSTGKENLIQQLLIDISSSFLLTKVQQTPTRGSNILDLVFTSNPTLVKSSVSIQDISDHDIIMSNLYTKPHTASLKACTCYNLESLNGSR